MGSVPAWRLQEVAELLNVDAPKAENASVHESAEYFPEISKAAEQPSSQGSFRAGCLSIFGTDRCQIQAVGS